MQIIIDNFIHFIKCLIPQLSLNKIDTVIYCNAKTRGVVNDNTNSLHQSNK